jgi:hypothetical protein
MLKQSPEDYFRKSITVPFLYCTLNEMKTRFTDLHARTALGLQLVPSIIAPYMNGICIRMFGLNVKYDHLQFSRGTF